MKTLRLRNDRKLAVKWLVRIPLYTSGGITAWALSATLHARDWEPLSWQALVLSFVLLVVLVWLVMTPLLVVQQLLEQAEDEKEE